MCRVGVPTGKMSPVLRQSNLRLETHSARRLQQLKKKKKAEGCCCLLCKMDSRLGSSRKVLASHRWNQMWRR